MNKANRSKIIWGTALVLWMGFIFFMSQESAETSAGLSGRFTGLLQKIFFSEWETYTEEEFLLSMSSLEYLIRKAAHFTEYFILGGLSIGFLYQFKKKKMFTFVLSYVFGTLYAVSDECHQLFISGRAGQFFDICIDSAGVLIGIMTLSGLIYLTKEYNTDSINMRT